MFVPRRPSSSARTSPRRHPRVAADGDARHRQRLGVSTSRDRAIADDRSNASSDRRTRRPSTTTVRASRGLRVGVTCARRNRLSAGARYRHQRLPSRRSSASMSCARQRPDRARAERDTASPGRTIFSSGGDHVVQRPRDVHRATRARSHRLGQRIDRDAGNRLFARGVDVGQHDLVGIAQRRAERVHQLLRPRVAVRLERDHEPASERRARRGQHRGDLGRDGGRSRRRPARRPLRRDARSGARRRGSPRAPTPRVAKSMPRRSADRHRGERVLQVVAARDRQARSSPSRSRRVALAAMHDAAAAERAELDVGRPNARCASAVEPRLPSARRSPAAR